MSDLRRQQKPLASGIMRWLLLGVVLVALATGVQKSIDSGFGVCGADVKVPPQARAALKPFVKQYKFENLYATIGTLWQVHQTGQLPECYLDKSAARDKGWRPGADLWESAKGAAIGGNRFSNREGRLPEGGSYVEADLDFAGGRRGARRLVYDRGTKGRWDMWITLDHYKTFIRVPAVDFK